VILTGAPPDEAGAHERVQFYSAVMGRLDAVRGRLLRVVEDRRHAGRLRFSGVGQYVRERMGLSLREARDLIRLDRALADHPVAFRMYASGKLGRRAAWLVTRVAHLGGSRTETEWVRYAMTHTLRVLEAAVDAMLRLFQTDRERWLEGGNRPPVGASFGEVLRACSFSRSGSSRNMVRLRLAMTPDEEAAYEAALDGLREAYGRERPEWFYLAVMARHFLDMHADADDRPKRTLSRKVIRRDNYTCAVPECLQRGGLEADHIRLRSRGGSDAMENLTSLCAADHRYGKHATGRLRLHGRAPDDLIVRMASRLYRKDTLISPALAVDALAEDPWPGHGQ
jgi:hypothetical protein